MLSIKPNFIPHTEFPALDRHNPLSKSGQLARLVLDKHAEGQDAAWEFDSMSEARGASANIVQSLKRYGIKVTTRTRREGNGKVTLLMSVIAAPESRRKQ